jgi:hypothetical protein
MSTVLFNVENPLSRSRERVGVRAALIAASCGWEDA